MSTVPQREEAYLKRLRLELLVCELNSKIGKDKHFRAAQRKSRIHTTLGLIAALLAALLASTAFAKLPYQSVLQPAVALMVALATAALGFLKLDHQVGIHRTVGNTYSALGREARHLFNLTTDASPDVHDVELQFKALQRRYEEAAQQADAAPTNAGDIRDAGEQNARKRDALKKKVDAADAAIMGDDARQSDDNESGRPGLQSVQ
ncbi:SLATT domain-containing protein [Paraburkholderia sp.]|uniref:SLATT domain-containing protein n=1 Tax=Paraburkholderia sp. TaxID=1926495 RepID=UPI00286ED3A2|nr:SLATT domain-containing protein [Paraburkholderia sp.]